MKPNIKFECCEEFEKDVKKYLKKYRTIKDDVKYFEELLIGVFREIKNVREIVSKHVNILYEEGYIFVIKERFIVKCLSNKGKAFRIIYIYNQNINKVIFVEMYYKGDKENEDKTLYLKKIQNMILCS